MSNRQEVMREIQVAVVAAVPEGEARSFEAAGREISLVNDGGYVYALDGMCTHQELPLDGGEVEDGTLTCEWHGATFDVCSGRAKSLPAVRPLRTYEARVDEEGKIFVTLPADA